MKSNSALMAIMATSIGAAMVSRGHREDVEEYEIRMRPAPPESEYIGMDTGAEPARSVEPLSRGDLERIAAAQAKRDRKAAKRLVLGNQHAEAQHND